MPVFNVYKIKNKLIVEKEKLEDTDTTYIGVVTERNKSSALELAKKMLKNGDFNKKESKKEKKVSEGHILFGDINKKEEELPFPPVSDTPKKAIFCDFNGVLDSNERKLNSENSWSDLPFYLPEIACPHRIYKLVNLALKHEADLIITSLHRLQGITLNLICMRSLLNSGIEEYVSFAKENKRTIRKIANDYTVRLNSRTEEVKDKILFDEYTHFVVFEDDHFIDEELNPIMVNGYIGITDDDFKKADEILSKNNT